MPPSPWLSARSTKEMYLTEMISVRAQKTSERTPNTLPSSGATPCAGLKHSFMA